MAFDLIYKGELTGTQVNFETGNLTDISTFDTDVRSSAIQNSITDGVTDRGASQDALIAMSGYLAANAHPDVTEAADFDINNASGNVLQSVEFVFDDLGHVTTADFTSVDLDGRYYQQSEVQTISGVLNTKITGNDGDISINATDIVTLSGLITGNDGDISINATDIVTLSGLITGNDGDISINATDIVTLSGLITGNDGDIATNAADIDILSGLIDSVEAYGLDDVSQNGSFTSAEVEVKSLRVSGDGSSASITGPAIITIDPDAEGVSGKVVIAGDLQVDGTTTTINSTSVQIDDLSLVLGTGAPDASSADGGGIIIDGTGVANIAEFTFDGGNNRWKTNSIDIAADIVGNASTASAWVADSTITLGGDLTGAVAFNAGSSETLTATIANGAVEGKMLAVDSVSGVHIDADQIDSEHYVALSIDNEHIANTTIQNDKLFNTSVSITGGAGLAGGGNAVLGGSAVSLSIAAGDGLTAGADTLDIDLDGTTLITSSAGIKVNSIGSDQISADSITEYHLASGIAGDNITFNNGILSVADADITAGVQSDLGHLNEIKLGEDSNTIAGIVVKGGVLILRGSSTDGITTSGSDGDVLALNQKTTVSYDGIVQIMNKDQDTDDGSWNGLWKVQGIIRRDSGSTISKVSCFTTKIHAGSNLSAYSISTTTSSTGFKILADNGGSIPSEIITTATLNYNWSQES
jgi:hypothetical protein